MSPVPISVVIPTRDRRASVQHSLAALRAQDFPPQDLEVVVVIDGSTDGTAEALSALRMPFALRVVAQPHLGAAAARNRGAAAAAGRVLLFLDDDIEATPPLVGTHARAHQGSPGLVALGDLSVLPPGPGSYFDEQLRDWGREMLEPLRRPGHRYTHRDTLSGHFSLDAGLFSRVGGFDSRLRCHEDYEIGFRLLEAGGRFEFLPDAVGTHHEITDLSRALSRKYQEGIADVQIGRLHPELRPSLLLGRLAGRLPGAHRALAALAFSLPGAGDRLIARVPRLLDALEALRLRWLWRRVLYGPLEYWYWRGVARDLVSLGELDRFVGARRRHGAIPVPEVEIDLRDGLEAAERRLDETTPDGVRLLYGSRRVGEIPPVPGAEPLRGCHLRPRLSRELARPLRRAIRREEGRSLSPGASRLLENLGVLR
jgi:glycosyltransferase involved in cell wall biosynthesis